MQEWRGLIVNNGGNMAITIVDSHDLTNPFQCPICMGLFYFENDYVKHKCRRKRVFHL